MVLFGHMGYDHRHHQTAVVLVDCTDLLLHKNCQRTVERMDSMVDLVVRMDFCRILPVVPVARRDFLPVGHKGSQPAGCNDFPGHNYFHRIAASCGQRYNHRQYKHCILTAILERMGSNSFEGKGKSF